MSNKKTVIFILTAAVIVTSFSLYYFYSKNQLPALSEKDIELTEAFCIETLKILQIKNMTTIESFKISNFCAGYSDFHDQVSSNYPEIMQVLALEVCNRFSNVVTYFNRGNFVDYKKNWNEAVIYSNAFLKAFRFYKNGTTVNKSNKFIKDIKYSIQFSIEQQNVDDN